MRRPLVIVPFEPAVAEQVAGLVLGIQQDEYGLPITLDDQPDLADVPGWYQQGAGGFWVALGDGGEVVGTIGLLDVGDGLGVLRKMFVAPPARGRERGTATALLGTLVAHARGQGLRTVLLGTTDRYLAAHRFYEREGFERVDEADLPPSFPRMAVDSRFYRLDL